MLCAQSRAPPAIDVEVNCAGAEVPVATGVTGAATVDDGFGATPGVRASGMFPKRAFSISGTVNVASVHDSGNTVERFANVAVSFTQLDGTVDNWLLSEASVPVVPRSVPRGIFGIDSGVDMREHRMFVLHSVCFCLQNLTDSPGGVSRIGFPNIAVDRAAECQR